MCQCGPLGTRSSHVLLYCGPTPGSLFSFLFFSSFTSFFLFFPLKSTFFRFFRCVHAMLPYRCFSSFPSKMRFSSHQKYYISNSPSFGASGEKSPIFCRCMCAAGSASQAPKRENVFQRIGQGSRGATWIRFNMIS